MPFIDDIKSTFIGNIIELWEIDASSIGGSVLRLSAHINEPTLWRGNTYDPFPIVSSTPEKALNRAPGRISLTVSNVNKLVFLQAQQHGDLIGAKVKRWRTLSKYLDGQPEADPNEHWPLEQYTIIQRAQFSRQAIEFVLANNLNLPLVRLPKRQILRDDVAGNLYSPGIGLPGITRR